MKKIFNLFKKIALIMLVIYSFITFCNQQKILNTYATNKEEVDSEIIEAKVEQDELNKQKENANSAEYIESTARETLNMYLPNERVYINAEN